MFSQRILLRTLQVAQKRAIGNIACRKPSRSEPSMNKLANKITRSLTSKASEQIKQGAQETSPMQSLREFFMHPLTWDRNNGYLNILLGLAIFGFCFCSSCSSDNNKRSLREAPKKA